MSILADVIWRIWCFSNKTWLLRRTCNRSDISSSKEKWRCALIYRPAHCVQRIIQMPACLFTRAEMWKLYCKSSSLKPHVSVFSGLHAMQFYCCLPPEWGVSQKTELPYSWCFMLKMINQRDLCKECGIECNDMQLQETLPVFPPPPCSWGALAMSQELCIKYWLIFN